eukprot:3346472-Pleurochrysis_carterae.AAC.1
MKHRKNRVEPAQVNRRRGMNLRTEMRPNRGLNQVRLRLPMATLSTRRGISTALMLPRCDRSLQLRILRPSWDG